MHMFGLFWVNYEYVHIKLDTELEKDSVIFTILREWMQ